ncbi:unnamed protein product, partial [Closterium sp. NIES-54]
MAENDLDILKSSLLQAVPAVLVAVSGGGAREQRLAQCSAALADLLGLPQCDLAGKRVQSLVHPSDRAALEAAVWECAADTSRRKRQVWVRLSVRAQGEEGKGGERGEGETLGEGKSGAEPGEEKREGEGGGKGGEEASRRGSSCSNSNEWRWFQVSVSLASRATNLTRAKDHSSKDHRMVLCTFVDATEQGLRQALMLQQLRECAQLATPSHPTPLQPSPGIPQTAATDAAATDTAPAHAAAADAAPTGVAPTHDAAKHAHGSSAHAAAVPSGAGGDGVGAGGGAAAAAGAGAGAGGVDSGEEGRVCMWKEAEWLIEQVREALLLGHENAKFRAIFDLSI